MGSLDDMRHLCAWCGQTTVGLQSFKVHDARCRANQRRSELSDRNIAKIKAEIDALQAQIYHYDTRDDLVALLKELETDGCKP